MTLARLKTLTAFFSRNNKSGSYLVLAWNLQLRSCIRDGCTCTSHAMLLLGDIGAMR